MQLVMHLQMSVKKESQAWKNSYVNR